MCTVPVPVPVSEVEHLFLGTQVGNRGKGTRQVIWVYEIKELFPLKFGKRVSQCLLPLRIQAPEIPFRVSDTEEVKARGEVLVQLLGLLQQGPFYLPALRDIPGYMNAADQVPVRVMQRGGGCLLYTSDAADE